jgi:thioredoxin-related protein
MKNFLTFIFLLIAPALLLADNNPKDKKDNSTIQWLTIEEVEAKVKEDPKIIFVDVYTDWCGWCKKMDRGTFSDPEVIKYVNKHFYAVKMDAEGKGKVNFLGKTVSPAEIAKSMGVNGYPTIVFIDPNFQNIQPVPGYRGPEEFKDILMQVKGEKKAVQPEANQ